MTPCFRPQDPTNLTWPPESFPPKNGSVSLSLRPGQSLPRTNLPNLKTLPPEQPTENGTCRKKIRSSLKPWLPRCAATNRIFSLVSVVISHHPSSTYKLKTRPLLVHAHTISTNMANYPPLSGTPKPREDTFCTNPASSPN